MLGLWFFFTHLPFTLLPAGDSGFIQGIFVAQEGSSPAEMHAFQKQVNEKLAQDPNVNEYFTLAGFSARTPASQASIFAFLKPQKERPDIDHCILQLQKSINQIPGITAILRPNPVLQINVGATNQNQGQYTYTLSGINPGDVYAASAQLLNKLREFKGFATVRSDYYDNTPNLTVDVDRERASTYGVSTAAVQSLLRTAYSQNYVYLIKQPDDQYQVILEVADNERAQPGDLDNLYLHGISAATSASANSSPTPSSNATNATTGTINGLVPLRAVTTTKEVVGPQAVNHFNQFTSVTINFNLLPGVAIGDATAFINNAAADVKKQYPTLQGTFQGEALVFAQLFASLPILLIGALFVMYVILGILYKVTFTRLPFFCRPSFRQLWAGFSRFGFSVRRFPFTASSVSFFSLAS